MAPYTPEDAAASLSQLSMDGNQHIADALKQALASSDDKRAAATKVAELVRDAKACNLKAFGQQVESALTSSDVNAREVGCYLVIAAIQLVGHKVEPYVTPRLATLLDMHADKKLPVRPIAKEAAEAVINTLPKDSVKVLLPILFAGLSREKKWQTKAASLNLISVLSEHSSYGIGRCLPEIIPHVSDMMWDTRKEVKAAATVTLENVCRVVGNADIDPFIPALVSCIGNPVEVPECVHKLASTTFVKTVEAPALAIMEPLLQRGLKESKTKIKRQTAVIIDNMCKLMDDPAEAQLFMPKLLPGLKKVSETTADPECREVADKAYKTLFEAGGEVEVTEDELKVEFSSILAAFDETITKESLKNDIDEDARNYIAGIALLLVETRRYTKTLWQTVLAPYLEHSMDKSKMQSLIQKYLDRCYLDNKIQIQSDMVEEEEGEDLCDCEFSLAYGGMILLNNARLRLKRGKRYGLCGPNGVGKSTLMRAIANGQLEGFPTKDQLRTVYVEHNLQASEAMLSLVDFIMGDEELNGIAREEVVKSLGSVGFTDEMQAQAVSSLSGGWKMKLELARAILKNADILLLDEPTNHLDVSNVKWLEDYLTSLTNVTSMVVSHDSGFLDNVCTHITHYETRKLKTYKGNLSEFVKKKPEAKAYYELSSDTLKFTFPEPGFLADIKNKGKPIIRLTNCSYQYPGAPKPSINNISVTCALSSRVCVVGPNGAGKSTMIKMLTGEVEPTSGTVWKHPSMRFAYVAQHAFHHIEEHLDISANEYIQWRFQSGEDKELMAKETRKMTDEEKAQLKKVVSWEGEKHVIEEIKNRRKLKKSFEYEVKWEKTSDLETVWIPRERLERWGFEKLVQIADDREAARANLQAKPCTAGVVQKHMDNFGLPAEFATHSRMRGLSGGQKVKVVLGAAMWQNPHILVLDEPTNYLDRDSLAALAGAIREFGGGVVIISHNNEFVSALKQEVWNVEAGHLTIEGQQAMDMTKLEVKDEETSVDAFGNVVKTKNKRKLTRKELKAKAKAKKEAEKRGEYWSDSDDE